MNLCLVLSKPYVRHAGRKNAALLDQVCNEVVSRGTGHFVAQALSNIVWGSAILEHVSPPTLEVSVQTGLLVRRRVHIQRVTLCNCHQAV